MYLVSQSSSVMVLLPVACHCHTPPPRLTERAAMGSASHWHGPSQGREEGALLGGGEEERRRGREEGRRGGEEEGKRGGGKEGRRGEAWRPMGLNVNILTKFHFPDANKGEQVKDPCTSLSLSLSLSLSHIHTHTHTHLLLQSLACLV